MYYEHMNDISDYDRDVNTSGREHISIWVWEQIKIEYLKPVCDIFIPKSTYYHIKRELDSSTSYVFQ